MWNASKRCELQTQVGFAGCASRCQGAANEDVGFEKSKRPKPCRSRSAVSSRGEEVNGRRSGNSGGEVGPLGFFYADCPTCLISQCTLQRPATEFEIDSHSLLIKRALTSAVRLFPQVI